MVTNIIRYIIFLRSTHDVLSAGSRRDRLRKYLALVLLIFFLIGYLFIAIFSKPDIMMAMVLFGGSLFVMIVLTLMYGLLDTVKKRSIDIAEVLVGVIDARDPNLNGHSRHVQEITMLFYRYIPSHIKNGINPVSLEYAALMHDVGKLGVPEAILNKPAKLTEEEWEIMRTHPKLGVKILKPLDSFASIRDWILYHHERIDGNGYYKAKAMDIPVAAKIIAIADTYSAITMRRSYKEPRTHEDAIKIIAEVAGTQLDKELVDIFLTIPKEELEKCIPTQVSIKEEGTDSRIDGGKPFDFGRTSEEYAIYRDIYPDVFYKKIVDRGLCIKGQKVLDLGTGTGVLPRNMYQFGAKWTGTDISPEQIEQAKKLANTENMNIDFYAVPTEDIDFPKESFDVITACQCFWYFDYENVIPKLYELLKTDGRLLILYMAWLPFEDAIAGASEEIVLKYSPGWSGAYETRKPISLPNVIYDFFELEDHEEYDVKIPFTRESWNGRIKTCRGVGASLSAEELRSFENEHLQMLDEKAPEEFEVLHYVALAVLKKKESH